MPLASLLAIGLGPAGHAVAAVAAVVLTLGSTNAYLSGAAAMAADLSTRRTARAGAGSRALLVTIALIGVGMIALYAAGVVGTAELVAVPTRCSSRSTSAARCRRRWC